MLTKFPYFYSLFTFSGCPLLCWAIYGPIHLSLYKHKIWAEFACVDGVFYLYPWLSNFSGFEINTVLRKSGSEVFMKSRQAETQRFPLISLSVSHWLIRKHHPIREEQTAWKLQAGTPKITHASLKLRMPHFPYFLGLALRFLDRIQAEITTLKREIDNKDSKTKTHPTRTPNVIEWLWLNQILTKMYLLDLTTRLEFYKNPSKIGTLFSVIIIAEKSNMAWQLICLNVNELVWSHFKTWIFNVRLYCVDVYNYYS